MHLGMCKIVKGGGREGRRKERRKERGGRLDAFDDMLNCKGRRKGRKGEGKRREAGCIW